jgi:putative transcriptional regulator
MGMIAAVAVLLMAGGSVRVRAQNSAGDKCYFLVARDEMPDPTFQQSVILMVPSPRDNPLIAGIIVNKPTKVTLAQLLNNVPNLKHPTEKLYFGGPVDDDQPMLLVRGQHPLKGTTRLMDKLYAGMDAGLITSALTHPWSPQDTRVILGRAQWTRDQLRMEILRGAWDAMPADVGLIFKTDAGAIWRGLQKNSHLREVDFAPPVLSAGALELLPLADQP